MADDEQFSLCWNNFNTNLSAGFHDSLCRGDLVDVTLAAEGQLVKAHRLVLSVCSPYFRKMFTQMPANQHAFVFLKDVSHSALKDLIQFMYCGEVNVKQDALPAFISTAEALQIKGLTETGEGSSAPPHQSPAKEGPSVPSASPRSKQQTRARVQSYKVESEESSDEKVVQVQTQKRTLQRSITPQVTPVTKRAKITADPLESSDPPTVQTVHVVKQQVQQPLQSSEPEYVEMPMETINPKSEPEYVEDTSEIEAAEQEHDQDTETHELQEQDDTTYVEDESYGDIKYDESYFNENDEAKAGVSGFSESYTEGGDQSASEAQEFRISLTPFNQLAELRRDEPDGNSAWKSIPSSSNQIIFGETCKTINVTKILQADVKCHSMLYEKLEKQLCLEHKELCLLSRTSTKALFEACHPRFPTTMEKELLAISILDAFPYLKAFKAYTRAGYAHDLIATTETASPIDDPPPDHSLFFWKGKNGQKSSGFIENCVSNMRKALIKSNVIKKKPKLEAKVVEITQYEKIVIQELSQVASNSGNMNEIILKMSMTFAARRHLVQKKERIDSILVMFPHYLHFGGIFINKDFDRLYPAAESLLENYQGYIDMLLMLTSYWNDIENKIMKTFLNVITELQFRGSKSKNKTTKEKEIQDFIRWIPNNRSIDEAVEQHPGSQPYILCRSARTYKDGDYFIVLDKHYLAIGHDPLMAFDLLFKSYFVFNAPIPELLKKLFTFVSIYFYKIKDTSRLKCIQDLIQKLNDKF